MNLYTTQYDSMIRYIPVLEMRTAPYFLLHHLVFWKISNLTVLGLKERSSLNQRRRYGMTAVSSLVKGNRKALFVSYITTVIIIIVNVVTVFAAI